MTPKPKQFLLSLLPLGLISILPNTKLVWVTIALSTVATYRIVEFISERLEKHRIFEKGNVPSIERKSIFTGNLLEVIVPKDNHRIIDRYFKRLGKTFGIFYGPDPWYVTKDLDLVQKIYLDGGTTHVDTNSFRIPFIPEVSLSLIQLRGEEWRRVRRALEPTFSHRQMKTDNVFRDLEVACGRLLNCIENYPIDSKAGGRIIDILYNYERFTIDVIFKVAYGAGNEINFEPGQRDSVVDSVGKAIKCLGGPITLLSLFFSNMTDVAGFFMMKFSSFRYYASHVNSVLDNILNDRRKKRIDDIIPKHKRKMIDSLIESVDSKQIDDTTLKANLFFNFAAGFETTANTLTILTFFLARNPEIQEKLRKAVMLEGEGARYLEWCVYETLRLYPVVLGLGRVLTEDITTSEGQTLFKGSAVLCSFYSIQRSVENWGPDAGKFNPDRFDRDDIPQTLLLFFGKGPRTCIGKNLALAEIKPIITRLLLRYRLEPCDSTPKEIDWISPNILHMTLEGPINVKFVELNQESLSANEKLND